MVFPSETAILALFDHSELLVLIRITIVTTIEDNESCSRNLWLSRVFDSRILCSKHSGICFSVPPNSSWAHRPSGKEFTWCFSSKRDSDRSPDIQSSLQQVLRILMPRFSHKSVNNNFLLILLGEIQTPMAAAVHRGFQPLRSWKPRCSTAANASCKLRASLVQTSENHWKSLWATAGLQKTSACLSPTFLATQQQSSHSDFTWWPAAIGGA